MSLRKSEKNPVSEVDREAAEAIAVIGRALAHPLRVQILQQLVREPGSANALSKALGVRLSNVSYHLKTVLHKHLGIVEKAKSQPVRGAVETFYEINTERIAARLRVPILPEEIRGAVKGASLLAFFFHASAAIESGILGDHRVEENGTLPSTAGSWRPAQVDEAGWSEILSAIKEAEDRIATAIAGSGESEASVEEGLIRGIVGVAAFPVPPNYPEIEPA